MSVVGRFVLALLIMWGLVIIGGVIGFLGYVVRERSMGRPSRAKPDQAPRASNPARRPAVPDW